MAKRTVILTQRVPFDYCYWYDSKRFGGSGEVELILYGEFDLVKKQWATDSRLRCEWRGYKENGIILDAVDELYDVVVADMTEKHGREYGQTLEKRCLTVRFDDGDYEAYFDLPPDLYMDIPSGGKVAKMLSA